MGLQTAEYHRQYHAEHLEKWREYNKRDYAKRKEAIRLKRQSPEYKAKLSAYLKDWRAKNIDKRKRDVKAWIQANPDRRKRYREAYGPRRRELYRQRKEVICARKRALAKTPKYRKRINGYFQKRRKEDILFALTGRLRATMGRALRRQFVRKSKRTMELIGCTPQELRNHIESLFKPGMTWENRHLWHVDHKIPLASLNLLDPAQQAAAFHYTNLQPLWEDENRRKHTSLPEN